MSARRLEGEGGGKGGDDSRYVARAHKDLMRLYDTMGKNHYRQDDSFDCRDRKRGRGGSEEGAEARRRFHGRASGPQEEVGRDPNFYGLEQGVMSGCGQHLLRPRAWGRTRWPVTHSDEKLI